MRVRSEWIESYRAQQSENQRKLSALATELQSLEQHVTELTAKQQAADSEYQAKRALVEPEVQRAVESELGSLDEPAESGDEVPADEDEEERRHRESRAQVNAAREHDNAVKQLVEERVNQHDTVHASKLGKCCDLLLTPSSVSTAY